MNLHYVIGGVLVSSLVTIFLRFAPFLFVKGKMISPQIQSLSSALPYAVMGMLVVYCLRDTSFIQPPYGLYETLALGVTTMIHIWKRNTLVSIITGTIFYMILIQGLIG